MTKKQRGSLTVVLLLMVNIEYNLSDFFPHIYSKDMSFIFCLCVPHPSHHSAINLLNNFFLYTIMAATAKSYICGLCCLAWLT